MPWKHKEDERAYKKKYREKHKERFRLIAKRGLYTRKLYPIAQPCSIEGCSVIGERHHPDPDVWDVIIWLCMEHHDDVHRQPDIPCSVKGCDIKRRAKGFCKKHYDENRNNQPPERICKVVKCNAIHMGKGYCGRHYHEVIYTPLLKTLKGKEEEDG